MPDNETIQFPITTTQKGKIFEELKINGIPIALSRAQEYVGNTGYVFASPDLTRSRTDITRLGFERGLTPEQILQHPLWKFRWVTLTEESLVGNNVHIIHGGYIFKKPERITEAIEEGLIEGAGKLRPKEIDKLEEGVREGQIPKTKIPVFSYTFFRGMSEEDSLNLPRQYSIYLTRTEAESLSSGSHLLKDLLENPLFRARAGANPGAYLNTLKKLGAGQYGNRYYFQQDTSRLLIVYNNFDYAFNGNDHLGGNARFLGVKTAEGGAEKIVTVRPNLNEELQKLEGIVASLKSKCK